MYTTGIKLQGLHVKFVRIIGTEREEMALLPLSSNAADFLAELASTAPFLVLDLVYTNYINAIGLCTC